MNWQPIETAPKDRPILLLWPAGTLVERTLVSVGRWFALAPRPYWTCQYAESLGVRLVRAYPPTQWCEIHYPEPG
ncbi:hypothetical protein N8I74_10895 [Chitiniphilus purpureus]|uniref:Uncharacterized protein n=1 Tax=Chitiniphilus purpureus TaxID=2981137 RepID=A0ABY6DHL3_9NEIS|nr:hypothetical protein [Chitiniphilus sp. CD1]UXY13829.1 hypothetical protein N8I74_10895 [Chitiniphilus sp. CD1]